MKDTYQEVLESGSIEIQGRLVDASNATLFGKIASSDGPLSVVYKPIAGERPLWDFPDGNLASREVAAYRISESRFDVVPLTVLRDGPFGIGAVQLWVDTPEDFDPVTFGSTIDPHLRRLALFDVVINNADRKFGHILRDQNGKLFGCDHGVSLHREWKLRTVLWQFAGSKLTTEEMQILELTQRSIASGLLKLDDLIQSSEIDAISARLTDLLDQRTFPQPDQDWPAIPWPPV